MWTLLPLALCLAASALWAGLTLGSAPRLTKAHVVPVMKALASVTLVGLAFGLLIGFASAKRAQEHGAYATLRDARQRLTEKPREPALWEAKIAKAETDLKSLESTAPPLEVLLDPLYRTTSLALALGSLGAGLALFRKRLEP